MSARFLISFLALCPKCNQQVTATPLFTRAEAKEALSTGAELEVMHATDSDHRWYLDEQERENLRRRIGTGEV